jgi:TANFOR domain-containing protein
MPPYSNRLSDYIATPGRIQSVITPVSTGFDRLEFPVYIQGVIMSTDESVVIRTKSGYKPASPIIIKGTQSPTGGIIFLPYTLTYSDILQIFNEQSLEYIGITREQVMQQGLPENTYRICFSLFDYESSRPLTSVAACSNLFNVTWAEAPIIIAPVNQAQLSETETKNVVFIWTRPPGAPVNTQYRLKIIELTTPADNYQDKLLSAGYPVFFETLVVNNTYLYSIANPQFTPGKTYAFMVTAIDPSNMTAFRNKGNSEPFIFSCTTGDQASTPASSDSEFTFIIPRKMSQNRPDTIEVNENQDLLINWAWVKSASADSLVLTDAEMIQNLGIEKYVLDITRTKSNNAPGTSFSFSQTFIKDTGGNIANKLQIGKEGAKKAGFADGDIYTASIRQYGKTNNLIATYTSPEFVFRELEGPLMQDISIQAVLKYSFKGFPELYPVISTDVIAEALVPLKPGKTDLSPVITIRNRSYKKIALIALTTDDQGKLSSQLPVPVEYMKNDTIFCRLLIGNQYYVDDDFNLKVVTYLDHTVSQDPSSQNNNTGSGEYYTWAEGRSSSADFGELVAKTYAYRLNLNVQKRFTTYFVSQDGTNVTVQHKEKTETQKAFEKMKTQGVENTLNDTQQAGYYESGIVSVAPGIPVILYRENKKPHIPDWEGNIDMKTPLTHGKITVVAKGITAIQGDKSYAVFDRLLASNSEKYKIIAVKDIDQWVSKQNQAPGQLSAVKTSMVKAVNYQYNPDTPITSSEKMMLESVIEGIITTGTSTTNFLDEDDYIATPMEFGLALPEADDPDAYYRTVTADYDVVSCRPPTSVIRGRLLYTWKSDPGKLKRPLANTRFRVIVNYVDENNISIGATKSQYNNIPGLPGSSESYTFFPDNPGGDTEEWVSLSDQYATMAAGITDANGNFEIETVNLDYKGDLGPGTVTHSKTSHSMPETTPGGGIGDQFKKELGTGLQGLDQYVTNPWNDGSSFAFPSGPAAAGMKTGGSSFGTNNAALGSQSAINSGFNVAFDEGLNSFELTGSKLKGDKSIATGGEMFAPELENPAHGPSTSSIWSQPSDELYTTSGSVDEDEFETKSYTGFKRVFRIIIDGDAASCYYPSAEIITVQPLEEIKTPIDITHYVREFEMKVYPKTLNEDNEKISLSGMQVTLFRNLADKKKNLPQGEGDGKYTYTELLNPQYNTQDAASGTDKINAGDIFSMKFEQLWPAKPTVYNSAGQTNYAPLPGLLQSQYPYYFIESSSYVAENNLTYQATIQETPQVPQVTETDWANPVIPVVETDVMLKPLVSRALITVRDVKSGSVVTKNQGARVMLSKEQVISGSSNFKTVPVDDYGKAEIMASGNSPLDQYVADGQNPTTVYFFAGANGYRDSYYGAGYSFIRKGVQFIKDIGLSPAHTVTGTVRCPDEKLPDNSMATVQAYVQVKDGKYFETNGTGYFEIPAPYAANDTLKIIPKDVAYFNSAYVFTDADAAKDILKLNDVMVYRRRHRIQFSVTEKFDQAGPPKSIQGATIQLVDTVKTTDASGIARFNFENVSVNNYTFVIRGAAGSGYIPKTVNMISKETKDFVIKSVQLEKGSEISGLVKLDGTPVKNARVYIDVSNTSTQVVSTQSYGHQSGTSSSPVKILNGQANNKPEGKITPDANLVVAYTDSQGKYTLRGVPVDNQEIFIRATLDTTFTVAGDKQSASIKAGKAVVDLNLKSYNQAVINKIYGFPLTVESLTPVNANQVKVTGLIHWTEAISDFSLNEVNKVLRIEDVVFNLISKGGSMVGIANDNEVVIKGVTMLKLSYMNSYNIALQSANTQNIFNTQPLSVKRINDFGKIDGKMKIVDNSFNYPSSYLNFDKSEFYLARKQNSTITNIVDLVTSALPETEASKPAYNNLSVYQEAINTGYSNYLSNPKPVYYLCDRNAKPIAFKLLNFPATANPLNSYIDENGKIHLDVDLTCNIANAQPETFTVNIPGIVLDQNKVSPASGTMPIKLALEQWTLEVKDWKFSTSEGGIVSENAMIRTKIVDIPVTRFVLRNDMFLIDKFQFDKIALAGGIFPLKDVDQAKAHLNFEQKVGSDMKPHWNFNLISNGTEKVASLPGLAGLTNPDLITPYPVDFDYLQILSNNEMIVQLKQTGVKARLNGNTLASFLPQTIYNGPNYMKLSGTLNVGAPRVSDILLSAIWTSQAKNPDFENVDTDFETKGFVHFYSSKKPIVIEKNEIRISGKVIEKPSKTFNPIPSTFFARVTGTPRYEVKMQKDWITQLTSEEDESITAPVTSTKGYSLKIEQGGMSVTGNDWTTCKFTGEMTNNDKSKTDDIAPTKTSFEVLGDISANSDKLSVSSINTPFGSMSQTFDFKTKELIGTLSFNYELTLGSVVIHKGTISSCFGAEGFYIIGACNAFLPIGILAGNYNTGLMLGSHVLTDEMWQLTNIYIDDRVVNWCYKKNTERLSGFYFAFNRELFKAREDFDFVLAKGYVDALGLIGGNTYVNGTGGSWQVGLGGYVYLHAGAGLSAITGTSISGGAGGDGKIEFQLGDPSYINASINLGFEAKISQDLGVKTVSKSISVDASANGGTSGFTFQLESGSAVLNSCKQ